MEHGGFDPAAFGRSVIARRQKLGWTSHRLAVKSGLSDPYVRKVELGRAGRLGLDVALRLADTLGAPIDDMLRDAGVSTGSQTGAEIEDVYAELDAPARRALLSIGHTLRELQSEYSMLQVAESPTEYAAEEDQEPTEADIRAGRAAAHDATDAEIEAIRRDAEEYEES